MFLWWLMACTPPPPTPSDALFWVTGDGDDSRTVVDKVPDALATIANMPGPADPSGHGIAVITWTSEPTHTEQLQWFDVAQGSLRALSAPATHVRHPSWAPHGGWVVYESDRASFRDLYRVDARGGAPLRLTSAPHGSFEPDVHPKGTKIAFASSRDGNAEIYVMGTGGDLQTRLTRSPGDDLSPAWLGDGQLAFLSRRSGKLRAYRMTAAGAEVTPLDALAPGEHLAVVPQRHGPLVALTHRDGDAQEIRIVHGRTGVLRATLGGTGMAEHPAWSPDGAWIAYTLTVDGRPSVWRATADGTHTQRVSPAEAHAWLPRWRPTSRSTPVP